RHRGPESRHQRGRHPRGGAGRTIRICDQPGHDAAISGPFKGSGPARPTRSCGAGVNRSFSPVNRERGRARGVCPPDGVDRAVITLLSFRPAALTALAIVVMTWSGLLPVSAQAPSPYARTSVSGSYLAARHAGTERDAAAAAAYYRAALRGDPRNNELLTRAFLAV